MPVNTHPSKQTVPSRQEVLEEVKRIVSGVVSMPPEQIRETDALHTDLGCDSLDDVEIVMEVEETFDISVPDEQAQGIRTVGDIADGVVRLLGTGQTD